MLEGFSWTNGSSTYTFDPSLSGGTGWFVLAVVTAGLAATRNRSRWYWFLWAMLFGPLATALLVVWPPSEKRAPIPSAPAVTAPPRSPADAEADAGGL